MMASSSLLLSQFGEAWLGEQWTCDANRDAGEKLGDSEVQLSHSHSHSHPQLPLHHFKSGLLGDTSIRMN
jgi:hypothetical protein